jgi:glucosamine 6-phosphate synthetase-like amidotransferase/phosphosugar isomerase protein
MCGIFGCVLKNGEVAPLIHAALKRLEYRGYDSVGEATIHEGKLYVKKDAGKIDDVHALLNLDDIQIAKKNWRLFIMELSKTLRSFGKSWKTVDTF